MQDISNKAVLAKAQGVSYGKFIAGIFEEESGDYPISKREYITQSNKQTELKSKAYIKIR